MVKIRLKRMGAKKRPFYRLVVADSRSPRDGRFIESVGYYDPLPNPARVEIDAEKVLAWISKGARPSDSARRLLQIHGVIATPVRQYPARPAAPAAEAEGAVAALPDGNSADGEDGDTSAPSTEPSPTAAGESESSPAASAGAEPAPEQTVE